MKSFFKLLLLFSFASLLSAGQQIQNAPANALRDRAYLRNPLTGTLEPATLIEFYSRNNSGNSETGSGLFSTTTTAAALGPDGTTSAWRLSEDTNNAYHSWHLNGAPNAVASQPYTVMFGAKVGDTAISRSRIWVNTTNTDQSGSPTIVDLSSGSIIVAGSGRTVRVANLGNGWWGITVTWTLTTDLNTAKFGCGLVSTGTTTSYTGNTTASALFWRVNCFASRSIPSSWIYGPTQPVGPVDSAYPGPAESSYGTGRYSDQGLELPAGTISATPAATSGFVEFIELGNASSGNGLPANPCVFYLGKYDRTGARLWISFGSTGYRVTHHNGTSSVTSELSTAPAFGSLVRLRWTFAADGTVRIFQSVNGAGETSATASSTLTPAGSWGATRIFLGSEGGGVRIGNVGIRRAHVVSGTATTLAQFIALR